MLGCSYHTGMARTAAEPASLGIFSVLDRLLDYCPFTVGLSVKSRNDYTRRYPSSELSRTSLVETAVIAG